MQDSGDLDVPLADIEQPWMPALGMIPDSIGPFVVSAEATWRVSDDSPFFDPRLIVDTCAQFVSSSFQARTSGELLGKKREKVGRRKDSKKRDDSQRKPAAPKNVTLLQAITCHAHEYTGAERFVLELVPRCQAFREQLRLTVRPLCAEMGTGGSSSSSPPVVNEAVMDYEVDRFFRARLVVCDLSELLSHDCFGQEGIDDEALARHCAVTKIPEFADGQADARDYQIPYDAALELTVERFELRFWRTFVLGLGRSLFGTARKDLVDGFQASAQDVFDRYEGELQLAMNSLMGWLPSWLSESLFIAFIGVGASVAVRQKPAKYTMLHRCVKSLIQSSGRYIFISTPAWYLPLVNWLPGLGRKELLRMPSVSLGLSLRTVWPAPCLDPDRCVSAVDDVWGGPKGARRAHLKLADGVETMGSWILRMTLGCEQLFSQALKVLKEYAPLLEEAYDELAQADEIPRGTLPVNQAAARRLSQASAEKVYEAASNRKRRRTRMSVIPRVSRASHRGSCLTAPKLNLNCLVPNTISEADEDQRRGSKKSYPELRRASKMGLQDGVNSLHKHNVMSRTRDQQAGCGSVTSDDPGQPQVSLLARLHVDSHGPTTSNEIRLRSAIATGQAEDTVWWPLGQSDTFRERIPIHRTPDLIPTAAPPILEDVRVPSEYRLPASARERVDTAGGSSAATDAEATQSAGEDSSSRIRRHSAELANAQRRSSTKSKAHGGEEAKGQDAFKDQGWHLQWFGLGESRGVKHTRSAPQLTMPEDFRDTLHRMGGKPTRENQVQSHGGRGNKRGTQFVDALQAPHTAIQAAGKENYETASKFTRMRRRSAPAAFDTSDFDVGDPARNTAVALALQVRIRVALASACSEGPLRLVWRQPKSPQEIHQLRRSRLNLGSMLLLTAMRAPLPTWEELPLEYFVTLGQEVPQSTLPPPKVRLPDGVYAMGCSPLFHYIATEDSARLPPLMAQSFHIGVPHAFLEDGPVRDAVVKRRDGLRWSEGSLLVLLTAGAFTESHLASQVWASQRGWVQQDYSSFFPLACCFRLVLGLEFVWQSQHLHMGFENTVTLEAFFPILEGAGSSNGSVSVHIDASAEDGAKPLLSAPWILPHKPAAANFDPEGITTWDAAYHPGCEAVALSEFAQWVGCLAPGRLVHSSHRSPTGDLYMRLQDAVIVWAFRSTANGLLSGQEIFEMYEDAVGDPEWWNVSMVTYILMPSSVSQQLETSIGNQPCQVYNAGETLDGYSVRTNSELIVCNPKMLSAFLGPLREPAFGHTKLFAHEIAQEEEEEDILRAICIARYDAELEEQQQRQKSDEVSSNRGKSLRHMLTAPVPSQAHHRHSISGPIGLERHSIAGPIVTGKPSSPSSNAKRRTSMMASGYARAEKDSDNSPSSTPEREVSPSSPGRKGTASAARVQMASKLRGSKSLAKRGDDARVMAKRLAAQKGNTPLRMPKGQLAQGRPASYVDWRNKRAGKPKTQQLNHNLEALTGLLTYIEEHCASLEEFVGASDARSSERSPSSSRGMNDRSLRQRSCFEEDEEVSVVFFESEEDTASRQEEAGIDDCVSEGEERTSERGRSVEPQATPKLTEDDQVLQEVKIERVPSPQRTEKSRRWRPPTPFPRLHRMEEPMEQTRSSRMQAGLFDYCGFGSWTLCLKEPTLPSLSTRRTRTSLNLAC